MNILSGMNWTHPICSKCYEGRYPDRKPVRVQDADPETCCDCGYLTNGGIYFRADPRTLKFPKAEDAA